MECFLSVLQAWLTPVIAIIALYIACQQWKTNQRKLKLDLYDKRYAIYYAAKTFFETAEGEGLDNNDIAKFNIGIHDADFLFDEEIILFIDELRKMGVEAKTANTLYNKTKGDLKSEAFRDACRRDDEVRKWFVDVRDSNRMKKEFKPYLDFKSQL